MTSVYTLTDTIQSSQYGRTDSGNEPPVYYITSTGTRDRCCPATPIILLVMGAALMTFGTLSLLSGKYPSIGMEMDPFVGIGMVITGTALATIGAKSLISEIRNRNAESNGFPFRNGKNERSQNAKKTQFQGTTQKLGGDRNKNRLLDHQN